MRKTRDGWTALRIAKEESNQEVVEYFKAHGAKE